MASIREHVTDAVVWPVGGGRRLVDAYILAHIPSSATKAYES